MTLPNDAPLQKIQFYATTPYSCGYLEGKLAQSLIAAPHHLIDANTYSGLIQLGFRRSGKFAYRPHCEHCNACVPVRIPVADFAPTRSQRRARKQHRHLTPSVLPLAYSDEHFQLYQAYQLARHSTENNGTDSDEQDTAEQYRNFLVQSNVDSRMIEFRLDGVLKMVSMVDIVRDGISAVYTFYDANDANCSYGTFNIVWLAEWAKQLDTQYLYLGYWIADSQKMAYKQKFAPQEGLINGEWVSLEGLHQK
jgi:arginyl-tRNA--protein-N-Asp/Glu arginylyltransferase